MKVIIIILLAIMSYLYGSIPFALIIGKVFYGKDIREYGSGNLGGTNAARVLGKLPGIIVIVLDMTKCIVAILITRLLASYFGITSDVVYLSAMCCVLGHCYPIFADFRGGKAISVSLGYLFMTNIYAALIAVVVFAVTLKLSKYVSLSSILAAVAALCVSPIVGYNIAGICTNALIVALIIFKHRSNIIRILNNTENKIS